MALAVNGVPLFVAELAIGQYFSVGTIGSWTALCPIARGKLKPYKIWKTLSTPRYSRHYSLFFFQVLALPR